MLKQHKRIFIFLTILLAFLLPITVSAEDSVDITIDYGVDGKIQTGRGFPMTITLTNQGTPFSGDLVIFSSPNYEALGSIVVPVELPKGEKKSYQVINPGLEDHFFYQQPNQQQTIVHLYKDGWEKGKKVKLEGDKKFNPRFLPDNRLVVGVLSDSPDALNFLKLTKHNGEPIEFLTITEENLASDAKGLEIFDVLLLNDFNVATISSEKQQALLNWVRSGGHLMLGSHPGLNEQLGEIEQFSLLTIHNQASFADLHFFPVTENEAKPSFETVTLMTGDVTEKTKVLYTEQSLPIVLNKGFGLGEVTQFAFNVGNETFKNWDPYTVWWNDVLKTTVDKGKREPQRYVISTLFSQLGYIASAFPSSFLPLTALVILFIVYLLFLVPGLYIVLKKFDKRENSWWIIPTVAVISSIAIFIVGAKDRIAGSQINDVSVLSLDDTGKASGYAAVSILTNSGGDYALTLSPQGFNPFPLKTGNNYTAEPQFDHAFVEKGQQQTKITFNDVEYWSIRALAGDLQAMEVGKLAPDLKVENNKIEGTIHSSLPFDLEEAYLLTGNKAYKLGRIRAGESETIAIKLTDMSLENTIGVPKMNIAGQVFPEFNTMYYGGRNGPTNKQSLEQWKKFELLNTVLNQRIYQNEFNQPIITGFAKHSLLDIKLKNKEIDSSSLTLITQSVEVIPKIQGKFTLTQRGMQTDISVFDGTSGHIYHNGLLIGEDLVDVARGKYQFTFHLPEQMNREYVDLQKLKLTLALPGVSNYAILNSKTNEFVSLADKKLEVVFEENANEFLAEDGSIVLVFEKIDESNPQVRVPMIYIEGEYKE